MGGDLVDWDECCVEDIAAPTKHSMSTGPFGSAISSKFFQEEGVPIIRGRNLSTAISEKIVDERWVYVSPEKSSQHQRSLVRDGDLVFTCWGTIDQVGLIDASAPYSEFILSNKQMKLTPDKTKATSLFLYYFFSNPITQARIVRNDIGSTIPGFNLGQLKAFEIRLPPLSEQKEIARILKSLDDKIELNRRMNVTLEGMAQALFKSWFVDFDPVIDNALAAGNPIPAELADRAEVRRAALADGTAKPFPAAFQQTEELGWIPKGWEEVAVRDLCEKIQNGGTPRKGTEEFWNSGTIPWLTSGEVRQSLIIGTKNAITEAGLAGSSAKWIPAGSTVVAMYGATAGQVAFVSCKLTTNQAVCALIPKEHFTHFNYLSVDNKVRHFENQARGSAQQNINKGIIESSITVLPSIDAVKLFEQQTKPMFHKRQQVLIANETIAKLRDTLLPKLISGELRIPDAEKLAEEALA